MASQDLFTAAAEILAENDRGTYTVPTKGLYPFQWNWDSCLTALGQQKIDESRAWTEIETLFAHQWPDGMVPHIIFHQHDDGYFPGPGVWRTNRPTDTSGITQPPVAGLVLRLLMRRAKDIGACTERLRALLPKVVAWHDWFYRCRDTKGTGVVALLHPWESGRDNSIDWLDALMNVPDEGIDPYVRRDTQHVDASQRPTKAEYDRYLYLVQHFRSLGWNNEKLHDASPFQVVDPGFNAILIRSEEDLAALAEELGETALATKLRERAGKARAALETLWSDAAGQYLCFDRKKGALVESCSVGGLLPLLAKAGSTEQQAQLAARIRDWRAKGKFAVPSHDPADPRFESKRYWRGPCWLIVNYLLTLGLADCGQGDTARLVVDDSLAMIETGFAEYYDPISGEALGGGRFTWTAAMILEFLRSPPA